MSEGTRILLGNNSQTAIELESLLKSKGYVTRSAYYKSLELQFNGMEFKPHILILSSRTKSPRLILNHFKMSGTIPYVIRIDVPDCPSQSAEDIAVADVAVKLEDGSQAVLTEIEKYLKRTPLPQVSNVHAAASLLKKFGVTPNYSGYIYLAEAITFITDNCKNVVCMSKSVYPLISKKFGVSAPSVERSIRTAIHKSWNKADETLKNEMFGSYASSISKIPTNSEFIYVLAEKLRIS